MKSNQQTMKSNQINNEIKSTNYMYHIIDSTLF
jgi:hypothetical protein